jgi:toll-interacting protein
MATTEGQKELSKRDRAFLGQLPDNFLRVEEPPRGEQRINGANRDQPHLVPMSYTPQQLGYRRPDASQFVGKLKVTILQAKLIKNYGITRMDPYCRVRIGHSVYETPTDVNGSKNPRWNKSFSINLPRGISSLYVEIFNERYLSLDDRIAWGYHDFSDDLFKGETTEEWIPLTGKQGDEKEGNVNLILSLTPTQPPPNIQQLASFGLAPPQTVAYQYPPGFVPYAAGPYMQQYPPGQQPQPAIPSPVPVAITDEDIKQIQEMFPTVDIEVIRSVLEEARGNKDQAVTNLLTMAASE